MFDPFLFLNTCPHNVVDDVLEGVCSMLIYSRIKRDSIDGVDECGYIPDILTYYRHDFFGYYL